MATKINRLTARRVDALGPGFHADGGGLYLRVRNTGSRSWVFRYSRASKVREIGLGATHTRTLADARKRAEAMRKAIADGQDPAALIRAKKEGGEAPITFDCCALALIESKRAGWRNAKHAQQWLNTLRAYAFPLIGKKSPADVTLADVKAILLPLWSTKTETASRLRQRIEAVLDWAYVHGLRTGENPARWRGMLDKVLPTPNKVRTVQHFAAIPYEDVPATMAALRHKPHFSAYCLRFVVLTAARSNEARGARWSEIDLDARVWNIPAERMKANRPHRVPLSGEVVHLLKILPRVDGQDLIFPGARGGWLSDVALNKTLRAVHPGVTVHGIRSSFRDWAAEQTSFPAAVCELALAHVNKDKVEAAYQRSDLFERRRELMQTWGRFTAGGGTPS
jgi:integrase